MSSQMEKPEYVLTVIGQENNKNIMRTLRKTKIDSTEYYRIKEIRYNYHKFLRTRFKRKIKTKRLYRQRLAAQVRKMVWNVPSTRGDFFSSGKWSFFALPPLIHKIQPNFIILPCFQPLSVQICIYMYIQVQAPGAPEGTRGTPRPYIAPVRLRAVLYMAREAASSPRATFPKRHRTSQASKFIFQLGERRSFGHSSILFKLLRSGPGIKQNLGNLRCRFWLGRRSEH